IPYADLTSLSPAELQRVTNSRPLEFGHTLEDQIGGQLQAGFVLIDLFEDRFDESDLISRYLNTFIATRAQKPRGT
ncbi:MAG: SAM-dependent methyltransferase, partial [Pirellulales bacterium]